jgi:serine/threonine-protein kinase
LPIELLDVIDFTSLPDLGLLPGEVLGDKYRIERVLGRGGMGVVLLARNLLLHERVAIKVLGREPTPASRARLLMEARATARLRSDHVVRVFDVSNTESGAPYLVMEYLEGEPLSEYVRRATPLPLPLIVRWALEVCDGLAAAHRQGIVHRDLKPANLFLERRQDGGTRVKILDFGIAKLPERESLATTTHPIGSPVYMAPEQLANAKDLDARTDIWGLGVVLYEMLTGRLPFPARSLLELAAQLRAETQPPACRLRAEVPESLSRLVDRCLEKRRDDRWANVTELMVELRRFAPAGMSSSADSGAPAFVPGLDADGIGLGETLEGSSDSSLAIGPPGQSLRSLPALSHSVAGARPLQRVLRRVLGYVLGLALLSGLSYSLWSLLRAPNLLSGETTAQLTATSAADATRTALKPVPAPALQEALPSGSPATTPQLRLAAPERAKRPARDASRPARSAAAPRDRIPHPRANEAGAAPSATARAPEPAPSVGPLPIDRQLTW